MHEQGGGAHSTHAHAWQWLTKAGPFPVQALSMRSMLVPVHPAWEFRQSLAGVGVLVHPSLLHGFPSALLNPFPPPPAASAAPTMNHLCTMALWAAMSLHHEGIGSMHSPNACTSCAPFPCTHLMPLTLRQCAPPRTREASGCPPAGPRTGAALTRSSTALPTPCWLKPYQQQHRKAPRV